MVFPAAPSRMGSTSVINHPTRSVSPWRSKAAWDLAVPVVVLVAVGIRVALLIARGLAYNVPDGVRSPIGGEVGAVARSIASGHGFGSPVLDAGETGPTASVSPLYPGLLGAVFSLSGIFTVQSAAIILFFNCVVSGLTCVPLMYAARRLYGPAVALACGVAWAASPYAVWHAAYAVQDASLTAFVFTAVLWAVLRLPSEQKIWPWAALGALLGLLVLMNAQAAGSTPFILGWLVWRRMRNGLRWRVPVAVAVGVCALFALPWMVRNSIVFGRPMFIRSNLGGELRLGFNAQCQGPATLSLWVGRNPEETKRYRELGEMAYFDEKR